VTAVEDFNTNFLAPGLTWFAATVPTVPVTLDVHVLLLAIAGQESDWNNIRQSGGGPGRGWFQFESETCLEILENPATRLYAHAVCSALNVAATEFVVYSSLMTQPRLQVAFARLDLWANPHPIPKAGDQGAGWIYYDDTWRPGSPRPELWPDKYESAMKAIAP
jgi:hypothetical protein